MRISSLPRFIDCPSSALPTEYPYDRPNPAAAEGSAVHKCLELWLNGRDFDAASIAHCYGADPDEVEFLLSQGKRAWRNGLASIVASPLTEMRLDDADGIEGTADFVYRGDDCLVVGDWKSNRVESNYDAQLMGYALAAAARYGMPDCGYVTTAIVWLRYGQAEIVNYSEEELSGFDTLLQTRVNEIGKRYAPGEACEFCPRRLVCESRKQFLAFASGAVRAMVDAQFQDTRLIAPAYPLVKSLRKALDEYDIALKESLAEGPQEIGDGYQLQLCETTRDKVIPDKAWDTLVQAGYTNEDLASCMTVSKTRMLAVTNERAPYRQKKRMKDALMKQLNEVGAIEKSINLSIKRTKVK